MGGAHAAPGEYAQLVCIARDRLQAGSSRVAKQEERTAPVMSRAVCRTMPPAVYCAHAIVPSAMGGDSGGEGTAHPDVVKHAKAGEADDVDCRQQYVDGKHRLPAPLCQNAAATEGAIVGSGSAVRVFARKP